MQSLFPCSQKIIRHAMGGPHDGRPISYLLLLYYTVRYYNYHSRGSIILEWPSRRLRQDCRCGKPPIVLL